MREPSTLAVVTDDGKGNPRYAFYREADRAFTREGLIAALPAQLELFQIGGFCTIRRDDAAVWMDVAREAARNGATITTDPNVRPSLIADMDAYRRRLEGVARPRQHHQDVGRGRALSGSEHFARGVRRTICCASPIASWW